jgi:hypothetical protein
MICRLAYTHFLDLHTCGYPHLLQLYGREDSCHHTVHGQDTCAIVKPQMQLESTYQIPWVKIG